MSASVRCAIYTRVSTDQRLDREFNSLHAQYDAAAAFIRSQTHEGWELLPEKYDDAGYSGRNLERPAVQRLVSDVAAGTINVIVVYKIDRLTRSLMDFAKLIELFERHGVSFASVTQPLNTMTSIGRLTLNVLLSSLNSSAKSPANVFATNSGWQNAEECRSQAQLRSAMTGSTANSSSMKMRPNKSAPSS